MDSISGATSPTKAKIPLPFIMRLPLEVLYDIFDHVTPCELLVDAELNYYRDLRSLRATCRVFRAINSNLKLWYDDSFCFDSLLERGTSAEFNPEKREARTRGLFDCFKSDEALLKTMARKRCWSFRTAPTLIHVAQSIPQFRVHITTLHYETYWQTDPSTPALPQPSINECLTFMSLCLNMTRLGISNENGDVSLDLISHNFPSLKRLDCHDNSGYSGSLRGLCNLERLLIWDYKLDNASPPRNFLPIDSTSSLTKLTLAYVHGPPQYLYDLDSFSAFTNLSYIIIHPLCDKVCKSLIHANLPHLRTLYTTVKIESNISVDNSIALIESSSLRLLQTLSFHVEPFSWHFNERYLDIIKAISSALSELELLQLAVGINTAWSSQFSSLRKLKEFAWIAVDEEFCTDPDAVPIEGDSEDMYEDITPEKIKAMADIATKSMEEAFEDFQEKPDIYIRILEDQEYDDWDELNEGYDP
jgi:hypothetical protein